MALLTARRCRYQICCVLAAAVAMAAGCQGPPPPPDRPTSTRVSVSARSIGIPYGPVVLLRHRDQLIAMRVLSAPTAGYEIEYEWKTAAVSANGFTTDESGTGTAEEKRGIGIVTIGPLRFRWSRASRDTGYLYWPQGSHDLSVCSVTWASVDDIDLRNPNIHWYTREMFE